MARRPVAEDAVRAEGQDEQHLLGPDRRHLARRGRGEEARARQDRHGPSVYNGSDYNDIIGLNRRYGPSVYNDSDYNDTMRLDLSGSESFKP